eukprot:gene14663-biopygen5792
MNVQRLRRGRGTCACCLRYLLGFLRPTLRLCSTCGALDHSAELIAMLRAGFHILEEEPCPVPWLAEGEGGEGRVREGRVRVQAIREGRVRSEGGGSPPLAAQFSGNWLCQRTYYLATPHTHLPDNNNDDDKAGSNDNNTSSSNDSSSNYSNSNGRRRRLRRQQGVPPAAPSRAL